MAGPNFLEAENWMKEIKKILDVMAVLGKGRVSLALFMLRDEADNWWDMIVIEYATKLRSCFCLITFQRPLEDKKELNLYVWFKRI